MNRRFETVIGLVALVALVAAGGGCKKQDAVPSSSSAPDPGSVAPPIPAPELKRGEDACGAYVNKLCGCAAKSVDLKQPCELARALPDAIVVGEQIAASADSSKLDVLHAQDSIRKTVKECIEQTAKLPSLGCP